MNDNAKAYDFERCGYLIRQINEYWDKIEPNEDNLTYFEVANMCYLLEKAKNMLFAVSQIKPKGN